jgi:hypothetical protein
MPCLRLFIPHLSDRADEQRLRLAYLAEPGVFSVLASHESRCIEIDFEDDEVTTDRLVAIAASSGFEARVAG